MAEVTWTAAAIRHWEQIIEYVSQYAPKTAKALGDRLMRAPDHLVRSPKMGRRVPAMKRDDLRELVTVRPYRIIYLLRDDECIIVAVIHGAQSLAKAMKRLDLDKI
jgi:plasmid stabilization system protein ParE